ncbi:hypothetical protein Metbo_2161 [Methanobacterium lacus]|uniref:Uncharacterized protein n=1 Tax=Methanobacterium lacus (strain AL-21) TaxID=877455 RepID=F0TCA9_METLA|nr:hypothetical protein [Methanobacterium lacus]ADZ10376.1 hypothetical protein Metbo_2161 [Methanobacterium lacus]
MMNKDTIPGYRNSKDWNKGFKLFMDYFRDSLKFIRCGGDGSKYHSDGETLEEMNQNFSKVVDKLVNGAMALQYISDKDFYYKNEDVEIIIKMSDQSNDINLSKLLEKVFNILKSEEKQFVRIVNALETK